MNSNYLHDRRCAMVSNWLWCEHPPSRHGRLTIDIPRDDSIEPLNAGPDECKKECGDNRDVNLSVDMLRIVSNKLTRTIKS